MFLIVCSPISSNVQLELAAHLLVDLSRDASAARLRKRFQPRGDVDALTVDVLAFADHVAEIDADAQDDLSGPGSGSFASAIRR